MTSWSIRIFGTKRKTRTTRNLKLKVNRVFIFVKSYYTDWELGTVLKPYATKCILWQLLNLGVSDNKYVYFWWPTSSSSLQTKLVHWRNFSASSPRLPRSEVNLAAPPVPAQAVAPPTHLLCPMMMKKQNGINQSANSSTCLIQDLSAS